MAKSKYLDMGTYYFIEVSKFLILSLEISFNIF